MSEARGGAIVDAPIVPRAPAGAAWRFRALLAGCLLLGSEVLLWNDPLGRTLLDALALLPGYLAVAALLLDITARYQVRDLFGLMTVAGVYGLLNAALLNPATALIDIPRTLVTRALGAHSLLGLEMLVFFLALTGGGGRSRAARRLRWTLIVGAAAVGLAWGAWVRWSPEQADIAYDLAPYPTMLLLGALGLVGVVALWRWAILVGGALTPDALRLSRSEGLGVGAVLLLIGLIRWLPPERPTSGALFLVGVLLAICAAILWFRRETKLTPLLAAHFPARPLPLAWLALAAAVLMWTGVFAYNVPRVGTPAFDQGIFVAAGFALYGLAWLPTVSLVLGARAYIRQVQARPL